MECARVLSQYEFEATLLVFVAFARRRSRGLLWREGDGETAEAERGQPIEAVLNNDIIGNDTRGNGTVDNRRVLVFSEDGADSSSRALARYVHGIGARYYPELGVEMIFRHDRFGRGGDHTQRSTRKVTRACVSRHRRRISRTNIPRADSFTNASVSYTAKVIRLNAAAAAALALAPKTPVTSGASWRASGRAAGGGGRPGMSRGASGYDAVLGVGNSRIRNRTWQGSSWWSVPPRRRIGSGNLGGQRPRVHLEKHADRPACIRRQSQGPRRPAKARGVGLREPATGVDGDRSGGAVRGECRSTRAWLS